MAVFTPVGSDALERWLADFEIGEIIEFSGIASGIENSNFFLTTTRGSYVLTLFERLQASELPFYLELMRHLAAHGTPCPAPLANRSGALFGILEEKPAALVTRLPGHSVAHPSSHQCALAAAGMARMHEAALGFPLQQPNLRGLSWWQETVPLVLPYLEPGQATLLSDELAFQVEHLAPALSQLPFGPIHADLFRDNALFEGDQLGGFIDFYFAGCDTWLFDVAVALNDWCIELATGAFLVDRANAFLQAYAKVRIFTERERALWPVMLRAAALRFWLSRLWDIYRPRPATLLTPHDPIHFERILRRRREAQPGDLPTLPAG
ncbi:MAG: homoserine kinase [Burkholderiaceae bacterium]|jgi:homoserine kinase type II